MGTFLRYNKRLSFREKSLRPIWSFHSQALIYTRSCIICCRWLVFRLIHRHVRLQMGMVLPIFFLHGIIAILSSLSIIMKSLLFFRRARNPLLLDILLLSERIPWFGSYRRCWVRLADCLRRIRGIITALCWGRILSEPLRKHGSAQCELLDTLLLLRRYIWYQGIGFLDEWAGRER